MLKIMKRRQYLRCETVINKGCKSGRGAKKAAFAQDRGEDDDAHVTGSLRSSRFPPVYSPHARSQLAIRIANEML